MDSNHIPSCTSAGSVLQMCNVSWKSNKRFRRSCAYKVHGRTDRVIPIYPPNFVCGGYNNNFHVGYVNIWNTWDSLNLYATFLINYILHIQNMALLCIIVTYLLWAKLKTITFLAFSSNGGTSSSRLWLKSWKTKTYPLQYQLCLAQWWYVM